MPPEIQEFTRDIDPAVPLECIAAIEATQQHGNTINIGAVVLPLIPVEFLIALKMVSGESKDDSDVNRLDDL